MDYEQELTALADDNGDIKPEDLNRLLFGSEGDQSDTGANALDTTELNGGEGEGAADDAAGDGSTPPVVPAAAPPAAAPVAAPPADPKPVLLAKDGVHTIEYERLVEAREEAARFKAENEQLKAAAAKAPAPAPAPSASAPAANAQPGAASEGEGGNLFGDYTDESLSKGVSTLIDKALAAQKAHFDAILEPLARERAEAASSAHYATIYGAHKDADSIVQSTEFASWKASLPSFLRDGVERVQAGQSEHPAKDFVDVLNQYRTAHPAQAAAAAAPAAQPNATARAQARIAQADQRTPTSLTDLPAGSQVESDEVAAAVALPPDALLGKFQNMSSEQIDAFMSRIK